MSEPERCHVPAPRTHAAPSPTVHARLAVLGLLAGAFGLRLWHLGARSVWTDEGSTWTAATSSLRELIRLCAQKDASPPLFYLLTSLSLRLGENEAHLRLVSALASLGLVWLTYRFMRLVAGRGVASLAAAITALSPFQLMYAQDARTYALVAFFSVASLYLFLRAVLNQRQHWITHAAVTTLAVYTQSIALLGLGVQGVIAIFTRAGRACFAPWARSVGTAALLYVPWFLVSMGQMSRLPESHWYLQPPTLESTIRVLRSVFVSPLPLVSVPSGSSVPGLDAWLPSQPAQGVLVLVLAIPLGVALRSAFAASRTGAWARAAFAVVAVPIAAVWVVSFQRPLWLPRYFAFLTPFIAALIAHGAAHIRPPLLAWIAAAMVLVTNVYASLRYDRDYTKERWRDVVRAIATQSPPDRTAALVPFDIDPFRFYNVRLDAPVAAFEVSHPEVPFASDYTEAQLDEMERRAVANAADYDEVWVVVRSPNSETRRTLATRTLRAAAVGRTRIGGWRWDATGGPVWATRYARAAKRSGR